MPIETPTPAHYYMLSDKLNVLCIERKCILEHRKDQIDPPWDVKRVVIDVLLSVGPQIAAFESAAAQLGNEMLTPGVNPSQEDILRAVDRLHKPVSELLTMHFKLWRQPFPPKLREGQALVSALIEKPLNVIVDTLTNIRRIINDPEKAIHENSGSDLFRLKMNFNADREVMTLMGWLRMYGLDGNHV
jgi:hypothetical protein